MIIIAVDFDGTLTIGNKDDILSNEPNLNLIQYLQNLRKSIHCHIKIVTARGAKKNLSLYEKKNKYQSLIEKFCHQYSIPYDEISFNKEYAHLYIDDMTINPFEKFTGYNLSLIHI